MDDELLPTFTRIETLVCSLHTHCNNDFLTREEAEQARINKLKEIAETAVSKEKNYGRKY